MKCVECNKGFSCGCQNTKAADGSVVHKTCLPSYNSKLNVNISPLTKKLNDAKNKVIRNG